MSLTERLRLLLNQTVAGATGSGTTQGAGDGPIFDMSYAHLAGSVQGEISGNPTACVINIMGLLDGATWDTLAVLDLSQGYVSGEIQTLPYPSTVVKIKANLATLSGGANPSVSCYFTAIG
jgi:hypothetical protein